MWIFYTGILVFIAVVLYVKLFEIAKSDDRRRQYFMREENNYEEEN